MHDTYHTVTHESSSSFTVEGSEFVGHVAPTETVDAAEEFISRVGNEHADATHNVPAYRVRVDEDGTLREWSSDDGEPSGSAGKPVLNVLEKEAIENVTAVVTRYYGGTKLGYGGLVRAYTKAVKDAIEATEVVETHPRTRLNFEVGYDDLGDVQDVLEGSNVEYDAEYLETVTFDVRVPTDETDTVCDRLRSATSGRVDIEIDESS